MDAESDFDHFLFMYTRQVLTKETVFGGNTHDPAPLSVRRFVKDPGF